MRRWQLGVSSSSVDDGALRPSVSRGTPTFVVDTAITLLTPTVVGTVASYSVSPALPAGLSLSTTSGVISGTPTNVADKDTYTVKASNAAGSTTAVLSIVVTTAALSAPSDLKYPAPLTFVVDTAITPLTLSAVGTVTSYSVSPTLPAGLSLDTTTGVISGTPTSVAAKANYTVRASNAAGSTTAIVTIVVNGTAPSIAYSSPYYGFTANIAAQPITPTVTGGAVVNWALSPALPAGLVFDTTNGTISGTPAVATAPSVYTVTAIKSGGQSEATMTLAIAAAPLLNLGHTAGVCLMQYANSSVMSLDGTGYWLLQAYGSAQTLASGAGACPALGCNMNPVTPYPPVNLAGNIAIAGSPQGIEVLAATSGVLLATIPGTFSWFQLASDGSYVATGSRTALTAWSTTGQLIADASGRLLPGYRFLGARTDSGRTRPLGAKCHTDDCDTERQLIGKFRFPGLLQIVVPRRGTLPHQRRICRLDVLERRRSAGSHAVNGYRDLLIGQGTIHDVREQLEYDKYIQSRGERYSRVQHRYTGAIGRSIRHDPRHLFGGFKSTRRDRPLRCNTGALELYASHELSGWIRGDLSRLMGGGGR